MVKAKVSFGSDHERRLDLVDLSRREDLSLVLDPLRVFQGLTAKQEAYAMARFRGANQYEAYCSAYDVEGCSRETIQRSAVDADRHPAIVARVQQLTAERDRASNLSADLSREFVINGIMRIAMMGQKETTQLRAYELLGKTAGIDLFRETTRVEHVNRTPEDVERELKARLGEMMKTIEGSARAAESDSPADKPKPAPAAAGRDRRRKPTPR